MLAPEPTFLIIGAAGNGTRWLRSNLDKHPQVCAPPIDTQFYLDEERLAALGHRWHRDQFADWQGEQILGECSPSYLVWKNTPGAIAQRIRKQLPDVRLVAIVGDPLERFLNAIARHVRWGVLPTGVDPDELYSGLVEPETSFAEMSASIQGLSLRPYQVRFGDNLKIVIHDDIRADPAAVYRSVLEHIGADPSFVPPDVAAVRFDDRSVVEIPRPGLASHQAIYSWWRRDVEILEELTGRDLSAWDPGIGPDTPTPEELMSGMMAKSTTAGE